MDNRPDPLPVDEKQEINGRHSNADIEQLQHDNEILKAELAQIKEMLADMRNALLGNGDKGILKGIRDIPALVEMMGRVIENLHRQIQEQNKVIEGLVVKLQLEELISNTVQAWEFKVMRDELTRQAG